MIIVTKTTATIIFVEIIENELIIMCDLVDDDSETLDTLLNQLQRQNSHLINTRAM